MRRLRAGLLLLALLAVAAPGARARPDGETGRFTVFAAGIEAGHETFAIERRGDAVEVRAEARLVRGDREQRLSLSYAVDAAGRPVRVEVRGEQDGRTRVATLAEEAPGELLGELREGEVSEVRRLTVPPGTVLLVEPFATPFLLLAGRYDLARGGPQVFPALDPVRGVTGEVRLTLREEQAVTVDGTVVLARRIYAEPSVGDTANLWVAEDGSLLLVARSVAGLSALRGRAVRLGLRPGEDPPDPEGVFSRRIRFAGASAPLAGTFTRPAEGPGRSAAVLLLTGSGPQDRNGNAPGTELSWSHQHSFAVALARRGIASLRYDERGVGGSGGTFADATLGDLAADAASALDYLRSREDVDPARTALLGHSEGALVAAMLARAPGGLGAVVLLGAPAEPLDRILIGQVSRRLEERGAGEPERHRILGDLRAFFEHVRLSRVPVVEWQGRHRHVGWLREHLFLSPPDLYREVPCPALVVHGERDAQVPPEQSAEVLRALGSREKERRLLPTLDHFMMVSRGGTAAYGDAVRRVAPEALDAVGGWLEGRLR